MYKKTIILLLLGGSFTYYYLQRIVLYPLKKYTHSHFDDQKKPIILWDVHHVILQKDIKKIIKKIWLFDKKKELLKNISWELTKDMFYALYHMVYAGLTAEMFVVIAYKHHNDALAHLIIEVANSQYLVPETIAIINQLHQKGYRQHIGSNIGHHVFQHLLTKPSLNSVFNNTIFELEASHVVNYNYHAPDLIIKKPNPTFFQHYLHKNNLKGEQIIFIDDKHMNVYIAQQNNMYGIQFKNADQLQKNLWLLLGIKQ